MCVLGLSPSQVVGQTQPLSEAEATATARVIAATPLVVSMPNSLNSSNASLFNGDASGDTANANAKLNASLNAKLNTFATDQGGAANGLDCSSINLSAAATAPLDDWTSDKADFPFGGGTPLEVDEARAEDEKVSASETGEAQTSGAAQTMGEGEARRTAAQTADHRAKAQSAGVCVELSEAARTNDEALSEKVVPDATSTPRPRRKHRPRHSLRASWVSYSSETRSPRRTPNAAKQTSTSTTFVDSSATDLTQPSLTTLVNKKGNWTKRQVAKAQHALARSGVSTSHLLSKKSFAARYIVIFTSRRSAAICAQVRIRANHTRSVCCDREGVGGWGLEA
eukprot:3407018-Pleurochrysis_carterae.AAC.1